MDKHDPADLDGDGEFDAIDIAFLEEKEGKGATSAKNNNGCCFSFTVIVFLVVVAVSGIKFFLVEKFL